MVDNSNSILKFLTSDPGWMAGKILDVRPEVSYLAGHLKGAVSLPLSPECTEDQVPSIILPPRHEPLLVVGEPGQQFLRLAQNLESRGRVTVTAAELTEVILGSLPAEILDSGPGRNHLWSPPPWLHRHLDMLPPPALGPVIDLGCGSGRAVVWLAERGYRITGLDWQPEALEMGRQLAHSRGVSGDFRQVDLRNTADVPRGPWSVILNFRYLQRDLLGSFHSLLQPGGAALVSTFREAAGYTGHPQARHRLARGELLHYFPRGQFEVLAHEVGFDPDGRPSEGIVARKI